MGLMDCRRIDARNLRDPRGALTIWEAGDHLAYDVKRVFILHDLSPGASRGNHAHRECHQLFIAFGGPVRIRIDDGRAQRIETVEGPAEGLHVPPMIWVTIEELPAGAYLMVACSHRYDEADYIRDREAFDILTGGTP